MPEAICKHEAMVEGGLRMRWTWYMLKVEIKKCVISDSDRVSWSREIQTRKKKCHCIHGGLSQIRSGFCTMKLITRVSLIINFVVT